MHFPGIFAFSQKFCKHFLQKLLVNFLKNFNSASAQFFAKSEARTPTAVCQKAKPEGRTPSMGHPQGHQAQAQKTRASLAKIVISTDEFQIMKTSKTNILAANSETKHVRWNAEVTLGCKVRFSHGSTINRWLPSAQARLLKTAFSKNPPGEVTHRAADTFAPLRSNV